jgi:hypothetical protein
VTETFSLGGEDDRTYSSSGIGARAFGRYVNEGTSVRFPLLSRVTIDNTVWTDIPDAKGISRQPGGITIPTTGITTTPILIDSSV